MSDLWHDTRLAARILRAHWGFTLVTVVTLALGIGANTAVFSAINGVLLRPLPYRHASEVLAVAQPAAKLGRADNGFSVQEVQDYGAQTPSLASADEYHSMTFTLYGQGDPTLVVSGVVSAPFFDDLGVTPILGRTFRPGEDAVGAPANAVLTHHFWQTKFGGDTHVVGRTFTMNDRIHTIIGVLPPLPAYPDENDIFIPSGSCPFRSAPAMMNSRSTRMVSMFVRVKPGVSTGRALADMHAVSARLAAAYPAAYPASEGLTLRAAPLSAELTRDARPTLFALMAMTALLLLIACANVANVSLARHIRRQREMAMRVALGARRTRLMRQLTTESVLIGLAGGALGLLLASAGLGLLRQLVAHLSPSLAPRADEIRLDGAVLLFTLAVSVGTGLIVGIFPGLLQHRDLGAMLRDGHAASSGTARGRLRAGLVVAQVAVASVLLVGAALLARTLTNLRHVDTGYDDAHVVTALVPLNWSKYTREEQVVAFADNLLQQLRGAPGVQSVGLASGLPLDGQPAARRRVMIDEPGTAATRFAQVEGKTVSGGYFATIGASLVAGRLFEDGSGDQQVVVVSRTAARELWPGTDPVGRRLSADSGAHWFTVIGVVRDLREHDLTNAVEPVAYVPFMVKPQTFMRVLVRSTVNVPSIAARIRSAVDAIDPMQPVADVKLLETVRATTLASPELTATLSLCFALVALMLTAIGLTGVVAFSVSQRTHELGIRLALGAERSAVLVMVMRQGMTLVVAGLAIGVLGALGVSRALTGLLFGVHPVDAATYCGVLLGVTAITLAACFVPARRATTIDPLKALRAT